jgi:outer membrane protein TolC
MTRFSFCLIALAVWPVGRLSAAEPLTLPAAVAEALTAGTEAALLRERLVVATALEDEAKSLLWPRLSLRGSYVQTDGAMGGFGMILGQRTFDNFVDFNHPGRMDNATAAVDFSYRIYAGGAETARTRAAAAQRAAAENQLSADLAELSMAVVRAYLDGRQARQVQTALASSRTALDASLKVAIAAEAAGRLLKSERLNLSVQVAQVEQEQLVADALVRLSARRLLILLGRPAGEVIDLATLPPVTTWPLAEVPAGAPRPEVLALRQRVDAAAALVSVAGAGRLPTVDFQATYQHDQGWVRSGAGTSWSAGVVARYNLFDGQETAARERAARAELRSAELALRQLEAEMAFELARAQLLLTQADQRFTVAQLAVEQAEESARLTRERFQAGRALSAELIGVEARLAEVRLQLATAESARISTRIALRRAQGAPLIP